MLNFSSKWREKEVDSWRNLLRNGILLFLKSRNLLAEQRKVHLLSIIPQYQSAFAEVSLKIYWKYHQIVSIEDRVKHCSKDECNLFTKANLINAQYEISPHRSHFFWEKNLLYTFPLIITKGINYWCVLGKQLDLFFMQ